MNALFAAYWADDRRRDRYLDARKLLRGSISKRSRLGLDWLNFFLADIQTGFGAFLAFYLAELGWPKGQVGLALAAGTIAGLIAHIPGGALVDWAPWKRGLAATGIAMIAASAIILALMPTVAGGEQRDRAEQGRYGVALFEELDRQHAVAAASRHQCSR